MANVNCQACEELRQEVPSLICDGFNNNMCTSLKNDTGLSASSGHNDCTDLNNLNDCLVGNMGAEVDTYEVCDWKTFMKKFIPNLWTTLKAIICAVCGIWTNIHSLWTKINSIDDIVDRIDCIVDYMTKGAKFSFSEYTTDAKTHIVAGKGVSFLNVSASGTATDITLRYIAGGLGTLQGSCKFYDANFTDGASVYNFDDNGLGKHKSSSRSGNNVWNTSNDQPIVGGELVYEIRLLKSEYPQIASLYSGLARASADDEFDAQIVVVNEGKFAWGQHGQCDHDNGDPHVTGADRGHPVPDGWIYIQMRISRIYDMNPSSSGKQYTPYGMLPMKIATDKIDC